MSLVQFIDRNDNARALLDALGTLGMMELVDQSAGTAAYKRPFSEDIKRCDELQRQLNYVRGELAKAGVSPWPRDEEAQPVRP